jgi:hypothetical protein
MMRPDSRGRNPARKRSIRNYFRTMTVLLSCLASAWANPAEPSVLMMLHHAELASSGEQPSDGFGNAVAVDGDTVVVGAEGAQVNGSRTGAAYVFVKPAGGWTNMTQTATLTASDNAYHFGASVAISGDTIAIGAPWTEVNGIEQQGAVYVFVKPTSGWANMTETAKLTGFHLDTKGEDHLGSSVSIFGNTIVVGVPNVYPQYGTHGLSYGEAMVYIKPATGWTNAVENAVLYVEGYPFSGAGFGFSVGISGNTVVVGATGCCYNGQIYMGQAYVYVEPAGGWVTTANYNAELTGTQVGSADDFGYSVAIDGNTVLVGSPQDDSFGVGAAYVYVEPQGGWFNMTETAELYPLFTVQGWFGQSVAMSGNSVFIGAPYTEVGGVFGRGAAYTFIKPKNGWTTTSKYAAKVGRKNGNYLGQSVGISGTTAVVGFAGTYDTNGGAEVFWVTP